MSKATLEFDLPEEREEFHRACAGGEAFSALEGISSQVRSWRKHGHSFKTADEALDAVWQYIIDETQGLEGL